MQSTALKTLDPCTTWLALAHAAIVGVLAVGFVVEVASGSSDVQ